MRRRGLEGPVGGAYPENIARIEAVVAKGIGNIPQFVNQVRAETAKVVWPTSRETMVTTVMVMIMTSLLGLFFFGIDRAFGAIVRLLLELAA
jgi:preprotein translocase subunit SecE